MSQNTIFNLKVLEYSVTIWEYYGTAKWVREWFRALVQFVFKQIP